MSEYIVINNLDDLVELLGCENVDQISRAIYKGTSCGAYCKVLDNNEGIVLGSIVEGVDDLFCEEHELIFPFTEDEFEKTIDAIEKEAEEIWENTHGCPDCGEPDEYNGGYIAINPNCKTCGGEGTIL